MICAKSAKHLSFWLGFYFEGDIGLCEINLAVRAVSFTCNDGCRFTSEPDEGAVSSILNPLLKPPLYNHSRGDKCCDIRLFNPLSSEKCILSRSNLLSLPVCLHFWSSAEMWNYTPNCYFLDVLLSVLPMLNFFLSVMYTYKMIDKISRTPSNVIQFLQ